MSDKHPGGRPTDFKPEYTEQVEKLCRLGATDKQLADFFDVTEQTINNWKISHTEFFESLRRGKLEADSQVANALFHRALGYSHPDVDIKVVEGKIVTTDLIKHYPPDSTAGIFWLKNRQPIEWRDKQEIDQKTEISGNLQFGGIEIIKPDAPKVPSQS